MEDKQKFLTLSEAAALTPYSSSYLSFLARKGKLRSIKEGDTWFTTREWVLDYLNFIGEHPRKINKEEQKTEAKGVPDNYLTSAQAERIFPYSSSYFSLRIRQGKLKGEKIGNKWFTTAEWINEYITEYGEKSNIVIASDQRERSNPESAQELVINKDEVQRDVRIASSASTPPRNDRSLRNLFNFSFLQPAAIALSILTLLIVAGPPKIMARWFYNPLAIAYHETAGVIGSLSGALSLDDNQGQVAGETVKSEK